MASQRTYLNGDCGFGISDCGFEYRDLQTAIRNPQSAIASRHRFGGRTGFTLVEMLVAMAITLVMMAAVVTLFANVSNSVRDRRATTEMSAQVRGVRNVLQQDLAGATCPGVTWQRPEANHGYIEVIEGPRREGDASLLIDGNPPTPQSPEIDHNASILPSSDPKTLPFKDPNWATDGGGLGDADDILMLTARNERKPFVGRVPPLSKRTDGTGLDASNGFASWGYDTGESTLAEVVWFAIENPGFTDAALTDPSANHFYGEPGMRTIYRRTLLIAPWLNPYKSVDDNNDDVVKDNSGFVFKAVPGLLRLLPPTQFAQSDVAAAIAALIAFQDRYDISCRVEWDYNLQHWKIVANTLGDLTKRENRYAHYGYLVGASSSKPGTRIYPFPVISNGSGYSGTTQKVAFVADPEIVKTDPGAKATAYLDTTTKGVVSYTIDPANLTDSKRRYLARPFAFIETPPSEVPATAWAMLNDDGAVVRVMQGPMPLWGTRRGEDVMLTDALGFDLRVYDPGAPLFATVKVAGLALTDPNQSLDVVLAPSDPGWRIAYSSADNTNGANSLIGKNNSKTGVVYPYVGQGAYVDLGYGFGLPNPVFYSPDFSSSALPWFFTPRALVDVFNNQLAPGYAVYDTWSFHYENDGLNEDNDEIENGKWQIDDHNGKGTPLVDEGTNGLDDYGHYYNAVTGKVDTDIRLGVDDVGERETTPPYDKPLRGIQVVLRAYERDSRAIRQVRVNQHFMAE